MPSTQTLAHRILRQCRDRGMRTAFGVHGANVEDLYAAAADVGTFTVVAKHEFAAGAMADGLARVTGAPSLVMTTSGGAAVNVLAALAESYDSRVPVLALIGSPPRAVTGRGGFQDMLSPPDTIDLMRALSGLTGYCTVLDRPDAGELAIKNAFATLDHGLPAAIVVPKDVQAQEVPESFGPVPRPTSAPVVAATPELDRLADQLAAERIRGGRICIWLGGEASRRRVGPIVERIANRLGAVVVTSPEGIDTIEAAHSAGVTGVMGHPGAQRAITAADTCLAIGCRMTLTDRAGLDDALAASEVVYLGSQSPRYPQCAEVIVDDLPAALAVIDDRLRAHRLAVEVRSTPDRDYLVPPPVDGSDMLTLRQIVETIDAELPDTAKVFVDAGNAGAAALHYLRPTSGQRVTVALGMGGMGYAIAAGIGVAIADGTSQPGTRTVVIAGDGAFFMHGMEIHTAVQYDAAVTLIVLNNNAHGMCVTREGLYFPAHPSVNRFRPTDIAAGLAAMFGDLPVFHPTTAEELSDAAATAFADRGPKCVVVDCHCDEIPPFAPFI
ncbi:thiamine pyrophosphate-binding protein [Gordonia sp. TBRC 11910]|uniref:acetolactate synthase n=1 Tax=Gordonia asplenii TaxID=2725283 RepID=A0A848LCE7_9ACTN|nr:thiamine pyrophosphate-dependent enzyme [Gordonia asplenii]NMO05228.1 thiamine pyrophosphate-binding protein [Gordonia asplenii]